MRLLGGALVTALQPNDGAESVHEQGSAVSVHLPAEALRVLPDMPEPEPEPESESEGDGAEPADPRRRRKTRRARETQRVAQANPATARTRRASNRVRVLADTRPRRSNPRHGR